jgi:hypothetical protein
MTSKERLALCLQCPALLAARKPLEKCALCGCFVRGKVKIPGATCPKGKW